MIRAGLVGAAFAAQLHAEGLLATGRVEIAGVVATSDVSRAAFVERWGGTGYRSIPDMLDAEHLDLIVLAMPNRFHCEATLQAAARGVHVLCEKPLAMNLVEAEMMVNACRTAGVHLLYAEQLCYAPRYVRVKELIDSGALGDIMQVQHWERHAGPHASWFHDPELSGGGVLLDMGCHGIEVSRWLLGKPAVRSVHARLGIRKHTAGVVDDHAIVTLEVESGPLAVVDSSWAAPGGIDERLEVLGTHGSVVADLARGQSLLVYSDVGVGYAAEKVTQQTGWLYVSHEDARNWGWHGEDANAVEVLEGRSAPVETGDDGRAVLELVMAAYESAAIGAEVQLPYESTAAIPIQPWLSRSYKPSHT